MSMIRKFIILMALGLIATAACEPMYNPVQPKEPAQKPGTNPEPDPGPDPEPDPQPGTEEVFEGAAQAVLHMGAGWNLGNTLDANSGNAGHMWIEAWTARTPKDYETAWGQPQATRELIHMFKEAGFGAIRVPVTWYPHMGDISITMVTDGNGDQHPTWDKSTWTSTTIDPAWMARVKEVVDYVIDEGLYCILNVHHDTGDASTAWLHASKDDFQAAQTRYQSLWEQIATTFKDYGQRLLFESYNEMLDPYGSWCFASFAAPGNYNADVAASAYYGINAFALLFTNTVRGTGGNNSQRNLIVNTYGACCGSGTWNGHLIDPLQQMARPELPGHLAIQVHSYWDAAAFSSQRGEIDQLFQDLDTELAKRLDCPVIIGEWGGSTSDDKISAPFASYFSSKAKEYGMAAFWWMGLSDGTDRANLKWTMPKTKDAILQPYLQ